MGRGGGAPKLEEIVEHRAPLAGRGDQASRVGLEVLDLCESIVSSCEFTCWRSSTLGHYATECAPELIADEAGEIELRVVA